MQKHITIKTLSVNCIIYWLDYIGIFVTKNTAQNYRFYYKEISSAHQGGAYLIKNTVKIVKYYYNLSVLYEYVLSCNVFCDTQLYFQHLYSSLQCHMIFRNHHNMLLKKHFWLSSMLNTVVLHNIFVETLINCIFQDSQINRRFKKTVFLFI